jgi:hypothetical protein
VVCRGICTCRFCLRENNFSDLVVEPAQKQQAAEYVLALGARQLLAVLAAEEEEVSRKRGFGQGLGGHSKVGQAKRGGGGCMKAPVPEEVYTEG